MPGALYALAVVLYGLAWITALALAKAASDGDRMLHEQDLDSEWTLVCAEYERLYGEGE